MPRPRKEKPVEDPNRPFSVTTRRPKSASMEGATTTSGAAKRKRTEGTRKGRVPTVEKAGGDDGAHSNEESILTKAKKKEKQPVATGTDSSFGFDATRGRGKGGKVALKKTAEAASKKTAKDESSDDDSESDDEILDTDMTEEQAVRILEATEKRLAQETITDAIDKLNLKPKNATTNKLGRLFEIPLCIILPGDRAEIGGKTYQLNPRNLTEKGVETVSQHYRKYGYEPNMGLMLGIVSVNGKSEPLGEGFREGLNPVAREKFDKWEKTVDKWAASEKDTPEKREALVLQKNVKRNKVFAADGQHR
jgi:hypothetical protein